MKLTISFLMILFSAGCATRTQGEGVEVSNRDVDAPAPIKEEEPSEPFEGDLLPQRPQVTLAELCEKHPEDRPSQPFLCSLYRKVGNGPGRERLSSLFTTAIQESFPDHPIYDAVFRALSDALFDLRTNTEPRQNFDSAAEGFVFRGWIELSGTTLTAHLSEVEVDPAEGEPGLSRVIYALLTAIEQEISVNDRIDAVRLVAEDPSDDNISKTFNEFAFERADLEMSLLIAISRDEVSGP